LNILSFSRSPVAGVAKMLPDIINKYTAHKAVSAVGGAGYPDGRQWFPPTAYLRDTRAVLRLIAQCDVAIIHNGRIPPPYNLRMFKGKRLLCYYHSEPFHLDRSLERAGFPAYVIAQGHSLLYPGMRVLPNLVDLEWDLMLPPSPTERQHPCKGIVVAFSPSNKHGADFMRQARFSPKGWPETVPVLERMRGRKQIIPMVLFGLPFEECMKQRRLAHIVVDEVLTGSYHRCTLEACSHAQVPVNACCPEIRKVVATVAGTDELPWVISSPAKLESDLAELVLDCCALHDRQLACRSWVERHWRPDVLWSRWWEPAIQGAKAA